MKEGEGDAEKSLSAGGGGVGGYVTFEGIISLSVWLDHGVLDLHYPVEE